LKWRGADRARPGICASPSNYLTQKFAAQAVPIVGALGGAAVNYAFIDHFQEIARGHFTVRRLERRYGKDAVRAAYEKLSGATPAAA
jgi:EcsC protein family